MTKAVFTMDSQGMKLKCHEPQATINGVFMSSLTKVKNNGSATAHKVTWKENGELLDIPEGYYWVMTPNDGVVMATFSHWSYKFQSRGSDDEGMNGFEVTHYMTIEKSEAPK